MKVGNYLKETTAFAFMAILIAFLEISGGII